MVSPISRRATLADVAAVARLAAEANHERGRLIPSLRDPDQLGAPELALRLLEDMDDGHVVYVSECEGRVVGFAEITGLMVGDGGHLVELRRIYVTPEMRGHGLGRSLLQLVTNELAQRQGPPGLRAWAPAGSATAAFLEAVRAIPTRPRWKVGAGGYAVRGVVYGWPARTAARSRAVAK